jgi:ATP-dependent Zn protease
MITRLGFGSSLGLYAPGNDDDEYSSRHTLSDSAAQSVDEEIKVHTLLLYTFALVIIYACTARCVFLLLHSTCA